MSPQHNFSVIHGLQIEFQDEYWLDSVSLHQIPLLKQLIRTLNVHWLFAGQRDFEENGLQTQTHGIGLPLFYLRAR